MKIGAAEIGEILLVGTTERLAVCRGGGDDQGVFIFERLDETAGVTGRNNQHLPLDSALGQYA